MLVGHGGINPPILRAVCVARKIASFYFTMKKLVAPGVTLIVSQYSFSRGRKFDWWCSHGSFNNDWETEPNSPTDWSLVCSFSLRDGHDYLYSYGHFPSDADAGKFFLAYTNFPSAGGRVGFIGEWYNSVCRIQPTGKYLIF